MVLPLGRCDGLRVAHIADCEMLASEQQKRKIRSQRITFDCLLWMTSGHRMQRDRAAQSQQHRVGSRGKARRAFPRLPRNRDQSSSWKRNIWFGPKCGGQRITGAPLSFDAPCTSSAPGALSESTGVDSP